MMTKTKTTPVPGHLSFGLSLRRLRERLAAHLRFRADRADYRQMLDLEPHLLKDIGLSQADVVWALHQRGDVDVGSELHAVRRRTT